MNYTIPLTVQQTPPGTVYLRGMYVSRVLVWNYLPFLAMVIVTVATFDSPLPSLAL